VFPLDRPPRSTHPWRRRTTTCALIAAVTMLAAAEAASPAGQRPAADDRLALAPLPPGVAWKPLVLHEGASLQAGRMGRPAARMLRLSDQRMRAGDVAVTGRLRPATTVAARAELNLVSQRLRRGKARALIAVSGGDGTSFQAGVLRRRSGRLAWALWVTAPRGPLTRMSVGPAARTRSWHVMELETGWADRRSRATLRIDGRTAARTPPHDLAAVTGRRVTLGLGRTSSREETGTLLLRSASVSTATGGVAGADRLPPAPAGPPPPPVQPVPGDFQLLPVGAPLPSDRECAGRVRRSSWEPRPENYDANHLTPGGLALTDQSDFDGLWNATFRPRVTGAFIGTTHELIQWAACKWGLSADMIRAQAAQESTWRQSAAGNLEARSEGNCAPEDGGDPCPTSFGLLQIKWYYNRTAYPMLRTMTPFHLDWYGAKLRGCYDGRKRHPAGDIWGCVGEWFSGSWNDSDAIAYVARVKAQLDARPWSRWEDRSATVPYRTGLVE
jgi:autotransporter family porin